jgi:putative tricarboxylic transport membrane protein
MESLLANLGTGFGACLALDPVTLFGVTISIPMNLIYAFLGCVIGTLIGVLPGLGPVATIAMLLPATYALPPLGGLIMLAGIYYGAQYGGNA